jgi:glutamyl-tRNA reductase
MTPSVQQPSEVEMEKLFEPLTIASLTHHSAGVSILEAARFADELEILTDLSCIFKGALLLQTCNRVEIIVLGSVEELSAYLHAHGRFEFVYHHGCDALRHLLSLAAGIDSMVIGEDQILGQMRSSIARSEECNASSPLLKLCINKAIHAGIRIRKRTGLNQGAVSVGSAGVLLAEEHLGDLSGKHILVIGGGEMGVLVTQALCAKQLSAVYVANRTYDRACQLAEMIQGTAVKMDQLTHYLSLSDVIISCTAAPHYMLHEAEIRQIFLDQQWPLDRDVCQRVMIDLAQPRDIDPNIASIPGVVLFTIDDLAEINDVNTQKRRERADSAKEIIEEELTLFIRHYNERSVESEIASLYQWADEIRKREVSREIKKISPHMCSMTEEKQEKIQHIIEHMSRSMVKKILSDLTGQVKEAAACGDDSGVQLLSVLMDK